MLKLIYQFSLTVALYSGIVVVAIAVLKPLLFWLFSTKSPDIENENE